MSVIQLLSENNMDNNQVAEKLDKMIELLEAIDWKLWELYNIGRQSTGEAAQESKVKWVDNNGNN